MFWAEKLASKTSKSRKKKQFLVCDYKTPSGRIHVGALRGVVLHEVAKLALKEQGKKAIFQYGFDDFDPMDGLPTYLPRSFGQYMGKPLSNIPAPPGSKAENYGQEYARDFLEVVNSLGIKPKIVWASHLYKKGFYDATIKLSLGKARKIRELYKKVANQELPQDWLPVQMVCQKCGRLGTTRPLSWDEKRGLVEYVCAPDWVDYARGCGYRGKGSPYSGRAKMPYKVEWAAKWHLFKTDIEGAGKDHQTKGGSRELASAIFREIYTAKPPENLFYEFFLVGGRKMSSSKGLGISAREIKKILPGSLLRFLMTANPPRRQINFSPEGKTIPQLFNRFDQALQDFWLNPNSLLAKVIFYAYGAKSAIPRYSMNFSQVVTISQLPHVNTLKIAQEQKGETLTGPEEQNLRERIKFAKNWLKKFAPEQAKFELSKTLPRGLVLSKIQTEFLRLLLARIKQAKKIGGEELHSEIHNLKNQLKIAPKSAFEAIYLIFLNRRTGPQAGFFLAALSRDFLVKRLQTAINKFQ